jgi:hypothetical protein
MHLLNVKTRKLEVFTNVELPRYGILSHTWESNEVTFDSFRPRARDWRWRRNSKKIDGCCKQALADGLGYVWIDTCCIDKKSSAELSEAINSMFSWYNRAAVCYVYLSDVCLGTGSTVGAKQQDSTTNLQAGDIRGAKWFQRGWTLQELLASSSLKIFDSNWNIIGYSSWINGDKPVDGETKGVPRLTLLLSEITGIPKRYLQGENLNRASVAERMSWAAGRRTTRTEDLAYCLLGIFGVNMPMLYGEGSQAFVRLQEEILKKSDDHSIFAWGLDGIFCERSVDGESPMAISPADFRQCRFVVPRRPEEDPSNHYEITNTGIRIELPLLRLLSGEYLARLNCTLNSGPPEILLEDKYLCLLLLPSRDRRKVFYRRTTASPILIPFRYFKKASSQNLYLAPSPDITYQQTRNGPLFVSRNCSKFFNVQFTYPAVVDIYEGVYYLLSDLWTQLKDGNGIYLDCLSVDGEKFALRIRFTFETDEIGEYETAPTMADISISRQRNCYSMAEIMMLETVDMSPEVRWERDIVIGQQMFVLEPTEANQWKIDILLGEELE